MRIVCVFTEQIPHSREVAERCKKSAEKFGYTVELYPSVFWQNIKSYNL